MPFKQQFKSTQNIAYQTILNGFKDAKLSHAYLLSGSTSSPLKEVALFIAQSFVCDNKVDFLACEECLNCTRIENDTYYDYIFIDGSKASIKKEQIEKIQDEFSKSALEASGRKIYIIHLIENSSSGAINSLLKFLEEPSEDVLAIITTQNIAKVLPTIVSRCQLVRIKEVSKEELTNKLIDEGYSQEDSYILTTLLNNYDDIKKFYQNENYIKIKDLVVDTFASWLEKGSKQLPFYIESEVFSNVNDKSSLTTYLDILEIGLKDILRAQSKQEVIMVDSKSIIEGLADKLSDVNDKIKEVILAKGNININANLGLLVDSLFYRIR